MLPGGQCAKQVAACYEGTCCMGTTIHAHVPQQDSLYDSFYYDEEWMLKWHKTTHHVKSPLVQVQSITLS